MKTRYYFPHQFGTISPQQQQQQKVKLLSCVQLFVTPWTVAYQTPPSMEFSRQEYGVGCHFLLQRIFLGLPHCGQMLYPLSHQEIPFPHRDASYLFWSPPHSAKDERFNFHLPSLGFWSLTFFSLSVHPPKVAILSWKLMSLLFPDSNTSLTKLPWWVCISLFLSGCWPLLDGVFLCGFFIS